MDINKIINNFIYAVKKNINDLVYDIFFIVCRIIQQICLELLNFLTKLVTRMYKILDVLRDMFDYSFQYTFDLYIVQYTFYFDIFHNLFRFFANGWEGIIAWLDTLMRFLREILYFLEYTFDLDIIVQKVGFDLFVLICFFIVFVFLDLLRMVVVLKLLHQFRHFGMYSKRTLFNFYRIDRYRTMFIFFMIVHCTCIFLVLYWF